MNFTRTISLRTCFSPLARRIAALCCALFAMSLGVSSIARTPRNKPQESALTVHEWGTFTSIAGTDGASIEWLPFPDKSDLPSFVERLGSVSYKGGLSATVRMETPVIYFYAARETRVSVQVSFSKGYLTEWYPHATRVRPVDTIKLLTKSVGSSPSLLRWDSVTVSPDTQPSFPREKGPSHYYAARETSADPITVPNSGNNQIEKFLFYRGVSAISPPISAKVLPSGAVHIENRTSQPLPGLVLFERRGDRLGYRVLASLKTASTVETPSTSGTLDSLREDFERILVNQGLFADEARAMLDTWSDSWFEEGSRLFYIVPRPFVDSVLPLTIKPTPVRVNRVFVGRIELVTPATERSIETALPAHDRETLQKYGRFLNPILQIIISKQPGRARAKQLSEDASSYFSSLFPVSLAPNCPTQQ
jgi:hypothetical protein